MCLSCCSNMDHAGKLPVRLTLHEQQLSLVCSLGPALQQESSCMHIPLAQQMTAKLCHGAVWHPPHLATQVSLDFLHAQLTFLGCLIQKKDRHRNKNKSTAVGIAMGLALTEAALECTMSVPDKTASTCVMLYGYPGTKARRRPEAFGRQPFTRTSPPSMHSSDGSDSTGLNCLETVDCSSTHLAGPAEPARLRL